MQMKMLKMYEMYARKSETLTERAIKDGSLPQKGGRKETYKNSRLCGREFLGWITIGLKLSKINRNSSSIDAVLESCSVSEL